MAEPRLRAALIGMGYWGEKLAERLHDHAAFELALVADRDPRRLPATLPATTCLDEVWRNEQIAAVFVATPPATHGELARAALAAGKHCWVEKPLALDSATAMELVGIAADMRRTLFVDETFLYDPLVETAAVWIRDGRLGRLRHIVLERTALGRIRRDSDVWWNAGPHDLSILRHWVPSAARVCAATRFTYLQPELPDIYTAALQLDGGIGVEIRVSWLSPEKRATAIAVGDRGALRYEGRFEQRALVRYELEIDDTAPRRPDGVMPSALREVECVSPPPGEPLVLALHAFATAVRTGEPAVSDGARSLETVRLLEAVAHWRAGEVES